PLRTVNGRVSRGFRGILGSAGEVFRRGIGLHSLFSGLRTPVRLRLLRHTHSNDQSHTHRHRYQEHRGTGDTEYRPRRLRLQKTANSTLNGTLDGPDLTPGHCAVDSSGRRLLEYSTGVPLSGLDTLLDALRDELFGELALGLLDVLVLPNRVCRLLGHTADSTADGQWGNVLTGLPDDPSLGLPESRVGIATDAGNTVERLDAILLRLRLFFLALSSGLSRIFFGRCQCGSAVGGEILGGVVENGVLHVDLLGRHLVER